MSARKSLRAVIVCLFTSMLIVLGVYPAHAQDEFDAIFGSIEAEEEVPVVEKEVKEEVEVIDEQSSPETVVTPDSYESSQEPASNSQENESSEATVESAAEEIADVEDAAEAAEPKLVGDAVVFGKVLDGETGKPVEKVTIFLDETDFLTTSNVAGDYRLEGLPAGTYDIVFSKSGYRNSRIRDFIVTSGQSAEANFPIPPLPPETSDEVFDLGEYEVTVEEANQFVLKLESITSSENLLSILDSEDFSKYAASDIGDAVKRVSGVTVEGGKYAVIRGLGDRYVSTTLNGLPIASPDPDRLAVQLDLFPTSLVSSLEVTKTFTPDQPGNSTGGINIIVDPIPDEFFLKVAVSGGFNGIAHGNSDFLKNGRETNLDRWAQGASDRGLTDALRGPFPDVDDLSKTVNDALANSLPEIFISQADFDALVAEFNSLSDLVGRANHTFPEDAELNHGLKVSFGDAFDIHKNVKLGYKVGLNYSRKSEFFDQADYFRSYVESGATIAFTPSNFLNPAFATGYHRAKLSEAVVTSVLSGTASLGLELGEDHALDFTFLDLNVSEDRNVRLDGTQSSGNYGRYYDQPFRQDWDPTFGVLDYDTDGDGSPDVAGRTDYQLQETLYYTERNLRTARVSGDHSLSIPDWIFGDVFAEWAIAIDSATQEEPGFLQTRGIIENLNGDFTLSTNSTSVSSVEPSFIIWRTIEDEKKTYKGDLSFSEELFDGFESKLKLGLLISESDRNVLDEYLELESFSPTIPGSDSPGDTPFENYDDLFPTGYATAADIYLNTKSTGKYIMLDQQIFENLRLIGGVRYENNSADVQVDDTPLLRGAGFDNPFDNLPLTGGYDEDALLPAVSVIWKMFDDKLTLRAAYSETLALPSAREVSPYASSTFSGSDVEAGNSNLIPSDVSNFDVGFTYNRENGDYLTINFFQKSISNRIERIAGLGADSSNSDDYDDYDIFAFSQSLGAGIFSWYNNPNEAELYGIEFELRKNLGFIGADDFSFGTNFTLIEGKVDRFPIEVAAKTKGDVLTSSESIENYRERELTGQPSQIFNADITYENEDWGLRVSLIAYYVSDQLKGTSLVNSYDVYSRGYSQFDLTLSKQISDNLKFGMSIKNFTDSKRGTYYQSVEETLSGLSYGSIIRDNYRVGPTFSFSLGYEY